MSPPTTTAARSRSATSSRRLVRGASAKRSAGSPARCTTSRQSASSPGPPTKTCASWADRGEAFFATVDVPIFDWLKAWSATRQAHIRLESFDITRDMARRNLSKEYRSALARVRLTWAQIETTRQQVSLSQENFHLSQVKYEGGEGLALDVVAAQSQLAQARGNYFSAIAAYFNARSDLEVAAGQ